MAFDFNGKHPNDPKDEFGPAASGEGEYEMTTEETPVIEEDAVLDQADEQALEAGDSEPAETVMVTGLAEGEEEEANLDRLERTAKASFDERLENAKSSLSPDEDGPTAGVRAFGSDFDETFWGRWRSRQLGIVDRGDYMSLAGKGRKHPLTGEREVTDAQLERMVAKAVLQKGWTNQIYIMRKGRIDAGLTARAEQIFHDKLGCSGGVCEGCSPRFCKGLSEIRTPNPDNPAEDMQGRPVWTNGFLSSMMHDRRVRAEKNAATKSHNKNLKEGKACTDSFRRSCEHGGSETPHAAAEKDRMARKEQAQAAAADCPDQDHSKPAGPAGMGPV